MVEDEIHMDNYLYNKLNKVLVDFLNNENSRIFRDYLDLYSITFDSIYDNELFETKNDSYSRKFNLNESVKIIDEFLSSFDKNLQDRFNNIIKLTLEDGTPLVNFIKLEDGISSNCRLDTDGKVYVYYDETLDDSLSIIHEVFHKLNILKMEINGERSNTLTNMIFTENVSFVAETALLDYMLNNGYITENDYALRMNKRIRNSSLAAELLIIEKELLDLVDGGVYIDRTILEAISDSYKEDKIRGSIWKKECEDENTLLNIIDQNAVFSISTLPYVIGQYYLEKIMDRDDKAKILLEINELVSNPDISVGYIANNFYGKKLARRKK